MKVSDHVGRLDCWKHYAGNRTTRSAWNRKKNIIDACSYQAESFEAPETALKWFDEQTEPGTIRLIQLKIIQDIKAIKTLKYCEMKVKRINIQVLNLRTEIIYR